MRWYWRRGNARGSLHYRQGYRPRIRGHVCHVEEYSVLSYRCIVSVIDPSFLPDRCDRFWTVTDPTGAHVASASVTALNTATGVVTATQTNQAGVYEFAALSPDNTGSR